MTHPLAVYTVIYLAILFVTVSIWGSAIAGVTGDTRILLFALGAFSLKLAIDDYVHFQSVRRERLHLDLLLSLLVYLLLAGSIAHSAIGRTQIAALQFATVFLVGIVWLLSSGLSGKDRSRRIGWLTVNIVAVSLLLWAAASEPRSVYTRASVPLTILLVVIVADFFLFGTLKRLADTADPPHGDVSQSIPAPQADARSGSSDALAPDRAPTSEPVAAATADSPTRPPTNLPGQPVGHHNAG